MMATEQMSTENQATSKEPEKMEETIDDEEEKKMDDASVPEPRNAVLWSEILATPSLGDAFSPAKQVGDNASLHGLGLQKALDKGKAASRSSRRCGLLLLEIASHYEQFGVALMKAGQANPLEGEAFKSIHSLSQQTRQLSSLIREEIALPLQGYMTGHMETLPAVLQKYTQSRKCAYEARQRAVVARSKYVKVVQEAGEACKKVKELATLKSQKDPERPDSSNTVASELTEDSLGNIEVESAMTKTDWERRLEAYGKAHGQKAVDSVNYLLGEVKVLRNRYETLVEKENYAVQSTQEMEANALEGLQKLEEQRLCLFYGSVLRTLQGIKLSLDNLVVSTDDIEYDDSTEHNNATTLLQKKGDFFTTFLKVGISQQEKTGVADAATLGLDEDVGKLRDQVQTRIAARSARIKKVKAMGSFFEEVSLAALRLGDGLKQVVKQEGSYASSTNKGSPIEHLRTLMSSSEGTRTLSLWNDLVKNMEKEAEASLQFSKSLKNIKSSKLDHFLLVNENDLVAESEQDDARWKHLCDAARTEMRADAKYRQSAAQSAKARERISSMDKGNGMVAEQIPKSPQKTNRARDNMNKALGNMFKILPDGGEQAMSILTPDARRAVVERSLQEADETELKLKQSLDQAVSSKARAMNFYRSKAEPLVKKYEMEDMSGVEDIKAAMVSLVTCVESLRKERYDALAVLSLLGPTPLASALLDIKEWVDKAAKETTDNAQEISSKEAKSTDGFMLSVVIDESETAKQLLHLAGHERSESFDSDSSDGFDEKKDESIKDASERSATQQFSDAGSINSLEVAKDKSEKRAPDSPAAGQQPQTARWLHKSFSTPIGHQDTMKTFLRFNSMGETGKADTDNGETANQMDDLTEVSTVSATVPPQTTAEGLETDCFFSFWPDYDGTLPGITHSFACAFLPKDCTFKDVSSIEHGRLFLTHKSMVFVAWRGKKAILLLSGIVSVEKHNSLFGVSDDTLIVTAQKGKAQSTLLLSCFTRRDNALEVLQKISASAREKRKAKEEKKRDQTPPIDTKSVTTGGTLPPVAPDASIKKMEVVLSKKLGNVHIGKFHQVVWSDNKESLYAQWLEKGDCYDISVGDWEQPEGGFVGPWCGESYTHKRVIAFKFKRKTHLYIGPPIAEVKQTQYCRVEEGRSVMQMTIGFDGIPYSDAFSVEVRWVGSRSGANDVSVQIGVFVEFHKNTMLKSKIRSGTITETKPVHASLFDFVKGAFGTESSIEEEAEENEEGLSEAKDEKGDDLLTAMQAALPEIVRDNMPEVVKDNLHIAVPIMLILFVWFCRRFLFSASPVALEGQLLVRDEEIAQLNGKVDQLQTEMMMMRKSLEEIVMLLKEQGKGGG